MKIHIFHNWSKWKVLDNGDIVIKEPNNIRKMGYFILQEKECLYCGYKKVDIQNEYI